jgi:hypothetical protein
MTKEQELNNLIPKIKSQVKQWRGKISTDVQNQIFEVINEMITAQDKIAELEKELKETREICDAVAHVGVDFGYGVYVLEDSVIHRSRLILEALKVGKQ